MKTTSPENIDQYISTFPAQVQVILREMRATIHKAAPEAVEAMKYGIPTFVLHGNLVHFAGCQNHIGFYPTPSAITRFQKELSKYKSAKGSVQFPLDQPLPLALVRKIVQFRVRENREQAAAKHAKRSQRRT